MNHIIKKLNRQNLALFLLRIILGSIFILHGGQKVLGWFGGPGLENFAKWVGTLGVPSFLGYVAAIAEFIGGILLLTGVATELGALLVIAVMLGAVFLVHWKHGYFIQNNGFEYPFNLILLSIALIIGGPGKYAAWDPFVNIRDQF